MNIRLFMNNFPKGGTHLVCSLFIVTVYEGLRSHDFLAEKENYNLSHVLRNS